jgi:hypothetical protein
MMMTTEVARLRIAGKIQATEAALDQALTLQAELFATMIEARRETGSGPALGQDTLLRLAKVQQTLLDAGGDLARIHGRLLEISVEKGSVEDCPPTANAEGLRLTGSPFARAA